MRFVLLILLPVLLLLSGPVRAMEAHYEAYAAGLPVLALDAAFEVGPDRYRVQLRHRTLGAARLLMRSEQDTVVTGRFDGMRPVPERFLSQGTLRGATRLTQIDYADGQPQLRQLEPPNDKEREPVPAALQRDTVDTVSAMAALLRQVTATGRCDGTLRTFDGRRLAVLESRTAGLQELPATRRSVFNGPALRCDFVGRQVGGFLLDEDRAALQRPQTGSAWFAPLVPGGPPLPVRIAFHIRFLGEATVYLAARD